ncbi:matrilin-4 isoform X1 [Syngnathoides biaculeatus]|uniref:matrilin-4 isoform X1 n=1 Tax=Syngnathoides biaculeatus TaxID=300417 RepID=UPI002ADE2071|nr:matrilin-4 isoform X1 [Syngnathoides biaculeatus]
MRRTGAGVALALLNAAAVVAAAGPRVGSEQKCRSGPTDLVFLIDSSRSVRPHEFRSVTRFIVHILDTLDIGLNATRVGLVQYSSQVRSEFSLNSYGDATGMADAVRRMVPLAQGTMTGLAIRYIIDNAFGERQGDRPEVPNAAVIVTDGRPQDRVAEVAAEARDKGVEIFAVGVARADVASLRAMASPPYEDHVFLVETFDLIHQFGLQFQDKLCGSGADLCAESEHGCRHICESSPGSFRCRCLPGYALDDDGKTCTAVDLCADGEHDCEQICVSSPGVFACDCERGFALDSDRKTCTPLDACDWLDHGCEHRCVNAAGSYYCVCPDGQLLQEDAKSCGPCKTAVVDLVLVIDGSKSVRPHNFELVKKFVNEVVDTLDVSERGTRVGLVQYSSRVRTEFTLDQFRSADDIKAAVTKMKYMEKGTMTGLALAHMLDKSFSEAEGARPPARGIPRIGLVFTDGRSQDDISEYAKKAKQAGIVMYAVGVGKALEEELREIASDPPEKHFYYASDFSAIGAIALNLKLDVCPEESQGEVEVKDPCACENLVDFQRAAVTDLDRITQSLAAMSVRLEQLERRLLDGK